MKKIELDESRKIEKPCPKCGEPIVLVPAKNCPQEWATQISHWCSCELCAKKFETKSTALALIFRSIRAYADFGHKFKQFEEDKKDGLSTATQPADPSAGAANTINDGAIWFDRYLRLCGFTVFPKNFNLVDMLISNPEESRNVLCSYEQSVRRLNSTKTE